MNNKWTLVLFFCLFMLSGMQNNVYAEDTMPEGFPQYVPMQYLYQQPDFTFGQRLGAGFLNIFFGAGSFLMGDIWTGFLLAWIEATGFASIGLGVLIGSESLIVTGAGTVAGAIIAGFIMPFAYSRPRSRGMNRPYSITVMPGAGGIEKLQFTYTFQF